MPDTVISVRDITKEYRFYKSNMQRIRHEMLGLDAGERIQALKGVSFDIQRGEKVGLIGNIGSGRTTIMRIMGGILRQDAGTVEINGSLTTVFDNRLGFDASLSGRDNMLCRATLMGWTKEQLEEHQESIAAFAELSDIIDQPMRTFPGGSAGRLGFTMSTEFTPDIMLYDESFVFGGQPLVMKCVDRLKELISNEETTFVMTAMNYMIGRKLCERGIVLHDGVVVYDDTFNNALKYFQSNCKADPKEEKKAKKRGAGSESSSSDDDGDDFEY